MFALKNNQLSGFFCILVLSIIDASAALCQAGDVVSEIRAVRINEQIQIDGNLSETVWQSSATRNFYQKDPSQGEPVSEPIEIWVAYDDGALYIATRMTDRCPDSIVARLARRDYEVGSDEFLVGIDSYHDHRNAFYFGISAAGTLRDGILYNDDWSDNTWDGVWEGKMQRTKEGWTAEMRIPFSQLRFENNDRYTWGINFERFIGRKKEEAYLVYTPRNESGFVSRFPHLTGIENITPPSRFEATPYITGRAEYLKHDADDPFNDGSKYLPDIGSDFKWGLGNNLTLDGTINPDFGQVEIDPAVVNLSDVETYFNEKRPFFLEGMSIFSFGQGGVNNYWGFNWSNPSLFYSRRIGRNPRRDLPDYDYAELPLGTHILGAAKITGKISGGWNLGAIEAVTKREYAQLDLNHSRWSLEAEPMSSYTVGRIQRDFNDGKQGAGILFTSVNSFFDDLSLKTDVNEMANVVAIDGWTAFDSEKKYMISGWTAVSNIQGTRERIINLQESSSRYFQRPDAHHISLDSSATSLTGYAGRFTFNKQKGNMLLNSAIGFVSPGFESGDLGFLSRTDIINFHLGSGYKWNEPTSYYRYVNIIGSIFATYDFGGYPTWRGIWGGVEYQFPNYHFLGLYYDYGFESFNNFRSRGGPKMLNPVCYEWQLNYSSDNRDKYVYGTNWYGYEGHDGIYHSINFNFTLRPVSNLSVTVSPAYVFNFDKGGWVPDNNPFTDPLAIATFGKRYLFADLNYKELSTQIRLDWTLTPVLSFQFFVQPLISSGDYTNFREFARPGSFDFNTFGQNGSLFADSTFSDGNRFIYLDPDGDGPAPTISLEHPNFRTVSLRGNAVIRWEYIPGSTLYVVWTQSRYESDDVGTFAFRRSLDRLIGAKPDNIFMLKLTYWIGH